MSERVETIARAFHESYERQAPDHGYKTREASAVPWEDVPADNKALMRAVVGDLLARGVIADASEVAEWLDDQCGSARAHWFLARFAGERAA